MIEEYVTYFFKPKGLKELMWPNHYVDFSLINFSAL